MYTEIIKIIDGGIKGDREKVINYANVLIENLKRDNQENIAKKIQKIIESNSTRLVGLDSFATKPIDQESRMDIVDITMPTSIKENLVFNRFIEEEVDDFVKTFGYRDVLKSKGIEITNTLLLYGPPGCGKTSLARYISQKTGLPLVTARLDSLLSSLLGNTAKNIRKIFEYSSSRPCILFLDEFDVIAKVRDDRNELGELKRVVNSLIQNIDNFNEDSILIAATNHQNLLDTAIWRRFNKIIEIDKPSKDELIKLIEMFSEKYSIEYCFIPLMEQFYKTYGFYPKYPTADAGYGSYNNYIYCEQKGMEKYMKFPMFKKETTDKKYSENPFRAVNFKIDDEGKIRCPNGKAFEFAYRKAVRGNQYGRQEEIYVCEDCNGCPYAEKCKKTSKNRTIRVNEELTSMHKEVIENLESIQGALLRMNRSIQAEGTFGVMKNDRNYKRIVRKGIKSVKLEIFLVSIGHNLYKYHNKKVRLQKAA